MTIGPIRAVRKELDTRRLIKAIDGVDELTLTTNGSLLARDAVALADAGLDRVTVSLDTLRGD